MAEETENREKNIDYHRYLLLVKELLPILTVVLIFIGYWRIDTYYATFRIDIYNYISVTEILLSFLPLIKSLLAFLLIILVLSFIGAFLRVFILTTPKKEVKRKFELEKKFEIAYNNYTPREKAINRLKNRVSHTYLSFHPIQIIKNICGLFSKKLFFIGGKKDFGNNLFFFVTRLGYVLLPLTIYSIVVYFLYSNNKLYSDIRNIEHNKHMILDQLAIVIVFVELSIYFIIIGQIRGLEMKYFDRYFLSISALFFAIIMTNAVNKIDGAIILSNHKGPKVNITVNGNKIHTDSNIVYIGQTQGYIFFRKITDSSNIIYKMNDIERLEIEGKLIK